VPAVEFSRSERPSQRRRVMPALVAQCFALLLP
jgi:hypothetical protein